jgi:hypothetical protein
VEYVLLVPIPAPLVISLENALVAYQDSISSKDNAKKYVQAELLQLWEFVDVFQA